MRSGILFLLLGCAHRPPIEKMVQSPMPTGIEEPVFQIPEPVQQEMSIKEPTCIEVYSVMRVITATGNKDQPYKSMVKYVRIPSDPCQPNSVVLVK
jgi:hypothetical protein